MLGILISFVHFLFLIYLLHSWYFLDYAIPDKHPIAYFVQAWIYFLYWSHVRIYYTGCGVIFYFECSFLIYVGSELLDNAQKNLMPTITKTISITFVDEGTPDIFYII